MIIYSWDDGYLYKSFSIPHQPELRWTNIQWLHELYCAGHFFEAATAYYKTTGKQKILNIAVRLADHIDSVFGPGKNMYPPGCENVENGLVKLYKLTSEQRYLTLAKFFIDQRGNAEGHNLYGEYSQDHKPFIEQDHAVGHAVRACYLYIGASDVAMLTGNQAYVAALDNISNNIASNKLYITGGLGAIGGIESFGPNYSLPNDSAYCETCAAISYVMWNYRMFLIHGHAKYIDLLERSLYNGLLSGVSLSGDRFFYVNPLENNGSHQRQSWFGCFCCPTNITRTIASIGGYACAYKNNAVYINLFINGSISLDLDNNTVHITQNTNYPWDGNIEITVNPNQPDKFPIYLRIPGWTQNRPAPGNLYNYRNESTEQVTLKVNSSPVEINFEKGFTKIERIWNSGDKIELNLPMPIRKIIAHPNVTADAGKITIERGPIVYCAEGIDNGGSIDWISITETIEFTATYEPSILQGVTVLRSTSPNITLIPYYSWANRTGTPMAVWLPYVK